jgi:hypothetical protein
MDVLAMKRYMEMTRMGMQDRKAMDGNGGMMPNEMFSQMNNNNNNPMGNTMWMNNNPMGGNAMGMNNNTMGHMPNIMMPRPMFPAAVGGRMRDDAGADMLGINDSDAANFRTLQSETTSADMQHANNSMMQLASKRRQQQEVTGDGKKLKSDASAKDNKLDAGLKGGASHVDSKATGGMPAKTNSLSMMMMDDKDYGFMPGTGVLQQHDLGGLSKCALCSKGEPTWFLVPCGHAALCDDCARYDSFFACTENLPIEQCPACGEGLLDPYFMHLPMLELWLEAKVQKRGAGGLI